MGGEQLFFKAFLQNRYFLTERQQFFSIAVVGRARASRVKLLGDRSGSPQVYSPRAC
jgi:hypothetical protein